MFCIQATQTGKRIKRMWCTLMLCHSAILSACVVVFVVVGDAVVHARSSKRMSSNTATRSARHRDARARAPARRCLCTSPVPERSQRARERACEQHAHTQTHAHTETVVDATT